MKIDIDFLHYGHSIDEVMFSMKFIVIKRTLHFSQ